MEIVLVYIHPDILKTHLRKKGMESRRFKEVKDLRKLIEAEKGRRKLAEAELQARKFEEIGQLILARAYRNREEGTRLEQANREQRAAVMRMLHRKVQERRLQIKNDEAEKKRFEDSKVKVGEPPLTMEEKEKKVEESLMRRLERCQIRFSYENEKEKRAENAK